MAAPKVYQIKSATFKTVAILGFKKVGQGQSGKVSDVLTDGAITITMVYVDGVASEISLETTDNSVDAHTSFLIGSAGSLVIVEQQRAEGRGATGGADKTTTYANAVLVDKQRGSQQEGDSTLVLKFRCSDPAGTNPAAYT